MDAKLKAAALLLSFSIAHGCVTSAQPEQRCLELEARYQTWGAVGAAAGAVAGGGAITTALPAETEQRLAVGLGSAGVLAVGAAAVFVANDLLAAYSAECTKAEEVATSSVALEF